MDASAFEQIVGKEHARAGGGAVDGVLVALEVRPGSAEEVGAVLRRAGELGAAVLPRGGGTKLGWANPLAPAGDLLILDLTRLDAPLDLQPDEGIAHLGAGVRLATLTAAAAAIGQTSLLSPLRDGDTVGGSIAADPVGLDWQLDRRLRADLLGLEVVLASGEVTRCGGSVVKNVTGFDLVRLYCGSLGSLGAITRATVRLHPLPERSELRRRDADSLAGALELAGSLLGSGAAPAGAVVQPARAGPGASLIWRVEGREPAVERALDRFPGDPADASLWEAARELRANPPVDGVSVRLAGRPTDLGAACAALAQRGGSLRLALPLAGVVLGQLPGDGLAPLVADAATAGLALAVERAPLELRRSIDAFGPPPGGLALMRGLKQRFDPGRLLAPGRVAGRI